MATYSRKPGSISSVEKKSTLEVSLIDKHKKPIKINEEDSSLEIASNGYGARITGDLEITGDLFLKGEFSNQNWVHNNLNVNQYLGFLKNTAIHRIHLVDADDPDGFEWYFVTNDNNLLILKQREGYGNQMLFDGGTITAADTTNSHDSALSLNVTFNDTSDSGSCIYKLIEGVATNTDITGWDELYLLHLTGASTFWVSNAGDVALAATKKLYLDGGTESYIHEASTDKVEIVVGGDEMLTLDEANQRVTIEADKISYKTEGGTIKEYSVADSAYAGTILGYTSVGIDASDSYFILSTTMTCLNDALKVKFVAPPSGVVEIMAQVYWDAARRIPVLGLSDANATTGYSPIDFPNSNDVTNEHVQAVPPTAFGDSMLRPHWVVTGLTPGTAYEWWIAGKITAGAGGVLRWGGTATNEYPPFIMKATALPAATADYAVYG